jgi:hypothetical protein
MGAGVLCEYGAAGKRQSAAITSEARKLMKVSFGQASDFEFGGSMDAVPRIMLEAELRRRKAGRSAAYAAARKNESLQLLDLSSRDVIDGPRRLAGGSLLRSR